MREPVAITEILRNAGFFSLRFSSEPDFQVFLPADIPSFHRVTVVPMFCKNGNHRGYPFHVIPVPHVVNMRMDVAVMPVGYRDTGCRYVS